MADESTLTAISPTEGDWIGVAAGAAILEIHPKTLRRLARKGTVTSKVLPGCPIRVSRRELEELARKSVRPGSLASEVGGGS